MITMTPRMIPILMLSTAMGCAPDGTAADDTAAEVEAPAAEEAVAAELPASKPSALTDAQIAHVAVTANTIDVETGRIAESRARSSEVRGFARTMIADHLAVNEQAAALAERLEVTPEDNSMSRALQSNAAGARAEIQGLTGEAFDRAYMEWEIDYHQAVLDALDQTLIPGASNEELRGLLEQVRPAIEAHLGHARSLASALASGR